MHKKKQLTIQERRKLLRNSRMAQWSDHYTASYHGCRFHAGRAVGGAAAAGAEFRFSSRSFQYFWAGEGEEGQNDNWVPNFLGNQTPGGGAGNEWEFPAGGNAGGPFPFHNQDDGNGWEFPGFGNGWQFPVGAAPNPVGMTAISRLSFRHPHSSSKSEIRTTGIDWGTRVSFHHTSPKGIHWGSRVSFHHTSPTGIHWGTWVSFHHTSTVAEGMGEIRQTGAHLKSRIRFRHRRRSPTVVTQLPRLVITSTWCK